MKRGYKMKELICRKCGTTDPNNFQPSMRTWCRKDYDLYVRKPKRNGPAEASRLKEWRDKYLIRGILVNTKARAKHNGIEFNITEDFIKKLRIKQNNKCAISGLELSDVVGNEKISIDRIDSKKGYTEDNVQLLTVAVNYMKQEYTTEYFLNLCKKIVKNYEKREDTQ